MNLRNRITKLERAAAPPAIWPMVVECRRVGDRAEDRAPGVYYDGATPTVVYEGDKPDEAALDQFRPPRGPGPLIITFGPDATRAAR